MSNVIPFPERAPKRRRRTRKRRNYGRTRTLSIYPCDSDRTKWDCLETDDGGGILLAVGVPWIEALRAASTYMRETLHPYGYQPPIQIVMGDDANLYPEADGDDPPAA